VASVKSRLEAGHRRIAIAIAVCLLALLIPARAIAADGPLGTATRVVSSAVDTVRPTVATAARVLPQPVATPVTAAVGTAGSTVSHPAASVARAVTPVVRTLAPATAAVAPVARAVAPVSRVVAPVSRVVAPVIRATAPTARAVARGSRAVVGVAQTTAPTSRAVGLVLASAGHAASPVVASGTQALAPTARAISEAGAPLARSVTRPTGGAVTPIAQAATPVLNSLAPVTQALAPVSQALTPVSQALAPVIQALAPVTNALVPVTQVLAPVMGALAPFAPVAALLSTLQPPASAHHVGFPLGPQAAGASPGAPGFIAALSQPAYPVRPVLTIGGMWPLSAPVAQGAYHQASGREPNGRAAALALTPTGASTPFTTTGQVAQGRPGPEVTRAAAKAAPSAQLASPAPSSAAGAAPGGAGSAPVAAMILFLILAAVFAGRRLLVGADRVPPAPFELLLERPG
jgi:hypothetical protein